MTFNTGTQALVGGTGADASTANGINRKTWYIGATAPSFTVDGVTFPEEGTLWLDTSTSPPTPKIYDLSAATWFSFHIGNTDESVYPHSVTIGDYSTPQSASASSTAADTSVNMATTNNNDQAVRAGTVTRNAERITDTALRNINITSVTMRLSKNGAPTGVFIVCIRKVSDDAIVAEATSWSGSGSILVENLTTTMTDYTFTFPSGTITPNEDYRLSVEYSGGSAGTELESGYQGGGSTYAGGGLSQYNAGWTDFLANDDLRGSIAFGTFSAYNVRDGSTTVGFKSNSETNPWLQVDISGFADKEPSEIALYWNAASTETEIKVQTSVDGTTFTDVRKITVSNLTAGAYNYIRFNRPTTQVRFIRIYGTGTSKVLSIDELKVLIPTESQWNRRHGHKSISNSNTLVGLSG